MSALDPLGDRMKGYEVACRTALPKRMPVIIRVDGKAFHSYTRGLKRPFDEHFIGAMDDVARALCSEIHGAVLAYVQSDEVSILVHNWAIPGKVWIPVRAERELDPVPCKGQLGWFRPKGVVLPEEWRAAVAAMTKETQERKVEWA